MKKIILILLLFITFNSVYASSAVTITGKSKVIMEENYIEGDVSINDDCNVIMRKNKITNSKKKENNVENNIENNRSFLSFLFSGVIDFLNILKTEVYRKLITMAWDKQIN